MQHITQNPLHSLLLTALVAGGAFHASAADVRVGISTKDTYVGMPVLVQVQVSNASDVAPPVLPQVDGLEIRSRGTPSQSTQITTVNGVTTKNTSQTYAYELTPQRAGSFRIPTFTIEVDGKQQRTRPIDFVASKSETGDLLFVEVAGKEQEIYVGQALDLTLKIWLRPFRDAERNITLSDADMWQMISSRSSWGMFEDRMTELSDNRQRPEAREVLRTDRDGVEHSYYLYEIDATIYPKSPGKINAEDVHVIVDYPTALGTARDPFGSMFEDMMPRGFGRSPFGDEAFASPFGRRLAVQSARPIVGDATVDPIDVLPIPTAGRPADYRGAVGKYHIVTQTEETSVKAGDPIELLIGIVGTGPMELVQAPPLAELSELTDDFKVPNEPLAGFVKGDKKVFSTTIRPREEGITQIPAIPFTFFDPQQEKFVTVQSSPISIHVDPADTLALDSIVSSHAPATGSSNQAAAAVTPLAPSLQNATGEYLLSSESPHRMVPGTLLFLLALPPVVVGGIWLARNKHSLSSVVSRIGFGANRAETRIQQAESLAAVSHALETYLGRRFGVKFSGDTAAIFGAIRAAGQHKLAVRCERVFHAARQTHAGGVSRPMSLDEAKHEALEVLQDAQRHHERSSVAPKARPSLSKLSPAGKKVASALILAALAMGSSVASANMDTRGSDALLTAEQQTAILAEAGELYDSAMTARGDDSAEAKQAFTDAAEKYQLLVDSGIANSPLYVNLASAYLQSGQPGEAIANYRRALQIDPTNHTAKMNLQFAEQSVQSANPVDADTGLTELASAANGWLSDHVSLRTLGALAVLSWFALWLAFGLRMYDVRFPWKSVAITAAIVAIASVSLYVANWERSDQSIAVVTAPSVALRAGDGDHFPTSGASLSEGEAAELVKQRGEWLKVRLPSGEAGWVAGADAEVI